MTTTRVRQEEIEHVVRFYLRPEGRWATERVARVLDALAPAPGERILDLGAGNATMAYHAARRGARAVALDRDPGVLVRGRAAAEAVGGPVVPRVAGDAARAPFRSGAFDKIVSADVVEHVPAPGYRAMAREAFRLLRPGGTYVVYTPNRWRVILEVFGEKVKWWCFLRRRKPRPWFLVVDPDHAWMKSPPEVERPLRAAGFSVATRLFEFHLPGVSKFLGEWPARAPVLGRVTANRILCVARKPSE